MPGGVLGSRGRKPVTSGETDEGMNTFMRHRFSGPEGRLLKYCEVGRTLEVSLLSIVLHTKPIWGSHGLYLCIFGREELTSSENLFQSWTNLMVGSPVLSAGLWTLCVTKS